MPSDVEAVSDGTVGGQQPLLPCGGQVMAKVNEVNTLFSPGEVIKFFTIFRCPAKLRASLEVGLFVCPDYLNKDSMAILGTPLSSLVFLRDP